ncbi:MAG: TatA/E family twin arginine-targeting protein translocase [Oscillatoriales cyanobacterium RM2_1_1]|nr:TatA/E family twin arginine-targeting protein translocase [Oscillatoriales cyanobacterium SM2_3_0]NJO45521.1 TatA/E family twin arginine-targeting protein translocase [Oscillatoriales cyanobacterium RM2_1_1]
MNIFGIGLPEMMVILVLALLVFGPKKLPEIGRSMGKAIRGFQEASREFENEIKQEVKQLEETAELDSSRKAITAAQTQNSPQNSIQSPVAENSATQNSLEG